MVMVVTVVMVVMAVQGVDGAGSDVDSTGGDNIGVYFLLKIQAIE